MLPRILPSLRSRATRTISTTARRLETPLPSSGPVTPPPKAELNPTIKSRPARGVDPKIVVAGAPVEPIVETVPVTKIVVESAPPPPAPEPTPAPAPTGRAKRPVGAFRGGLIGFLLGTSLVGGYGYMYLLDDYTSASSVLLASVEELRESTEKMTTHIKRIERVETELEKVVKNAAGKSDVESLRAEYKKLIDASHLDHLDLKAHLWGVVVSTSYLLTLALTTFTVASPFRIVKRDVATISTAIDLIQTDVIVLDNLLLAFTGEIGDAFNVAIQGQTVQDDLDQATAAVTANGAVGAADSVALFTKLANFESIILNAVDQLVAKHDLFAAAGLASIVKSQNEALQLSTDAFADALIANSDASTTEAATAYKARIDAAFALAVAAYALD